MLCHLLEGGGAAYLACANGCQALHRTELIVVRTAWICCFVPLLSLRASVQSEERRGSPGDRGHMSQSKYPELGFALANTALSHRLFLMRLGTTPAPTPTPTPGDREGPQLVSARRSHTRQERASGCAAEMEPDHPVSHDTHPRTPLPHVQTAPASTRRCARGGRVHLLEICVG